MSHLKLRTPAHRIPVQAGVWRSGLSSLAPDRHDLQTPGRLLKFRIHHRTAITAAV